MRQLFTVSICILLAPVFAGAHGVGAVAHAPVPVAYAVSVGFLSVIVSFLIALFSPRRSHKKLTPIQIQIPFLSEILTFFRFFLLITILFALCYSTSLPTYFWLYFLVFGTLATVLIGNIYEFFNPLRTFSELFFRTPQSRKLPGWICIALLYLLFWFELISEFSQESQVLRIILVAYIIVSLILGRVYAQWFEEGEIFSVLFRTIGYVSLSHIDTSKNALVLKSPTPIFTPSVVIVSMLIVSASFDNILQTAWWEGMSTMLPFYSDRIAGTIGFTMMLSFFVGSFYLSMALLQDDVRQSSSGQHTVLRLMELFAPAFIPVATGYLLAHNASLIVTNIFHFQSSIVEVIWIIQMLCIIFAHVLSTFFAHKIAKNVFITDALVRKSQRSVIVFMLIITCLSLLVLQSPFK